MNDTDIVNRFTFHPPTIEQVQVYKDIRDNASTLARLINIICPDSREKSLALTNIEQAVMWANASIARYSKD